MLDHTLRPSFKSLPHVKNNSSIEGARSYVKIVSFKSLTNVYNLRKDVFFYYRQVYGGMVAVWNNVTEEQWLFMKEISSDGDISTVRMCELYIAHGANVSSKTQKNNFPVCVYICVRGGTYAVAALDDAFITLLSMHIAS